MKSYRRLCADLQAHSGLPELSIDERILARVREAVSIAKQLDKAAHLKSRREQNAQMRKKLAVRHTGARTLCGLH